MCLSGEIPQPAHIHDEPAGCGPHNLYYDNTVRIAQPLQRSPSLNVIWHRLDVLRRPRIPSPLARHFPRNTRRRALLSYSAHGASPKAKAQESPSLSDVNST
jgi:hypothetical protein